jgi:hypothetical protein
MAPDAPHGKPAPERRGGYRRGAGRKAKFAENQKQICVFLPVSLVEAIDAEAQERGCSRADVVMAQFGYEVPAT